MNEKFVTKDEMSQYATLQHLKRLEEQLWTLRDSSNEVLRDITFHLKHLNDLYSSKLSDPTFPASDRSPHHPHRDPVENPIQLSPASETRQNLKQETLVRSSTHQIPLSDHTRFVWFDIEQEQGLLHVRVEEYS